MRIAGFMLRVYRFPIPELLIVGITALTIVSFGTASAFLRIRSAYEVVSGATGLPKFVAVIVLSVFLWEFISMVRGPFANTLLSLPLSRLDLYVTYLVGSILAPLTIIAIPTLVTCLTTVTHLGWDLAIAMFSVLSNAVMIFAIASSTGILTRSRGLAVGLAIALWISLPVIATVLMILWRGIAPTTTRELTVSQLVALACLEPTSIVRYAIVRGIDLGSILIKSGVIDLSIALAVMISTGYLIVKRWEPT